MARRNHDKKRGRMRLDRLVEARKAKHLTQTEVAERIGVNIRQVARYESGENNPTIDVAIKIAKLYGVSLDWLGGLSDDPQGRIMEKDLTVAQQRLLKIYRGLQDNPHKFRELIATIVSDEDLVSDD